MGSLIENRVGRLDIIGPPYLVDGPKTHTDTRTGAVARYTWRGTFNECNQTQVNALAAGATDIDFQNTKDGSWEITATFPWDQNGYPNGAGAPIASVHELEQNSCQRSLLESPVAQARYTLAQMAAVQYNVTQYNTGASPPGYNGSTAPIPLFNAWVSYCASMSNGSTDCGTLFKAIAAKGLVSFEDYEYVYRRTIIGATAAQIGFAHTGENQIWTSVDVANWEGIPANGIFQLPAGKLWHKAFGSVTAVAHQKTQVNYFYTQRAATNLSSITYVGYSANAQAQLSDQPGT